MRTSPLLAGIPHGFTERIDGDLRPGAPGAEAAAQRLVQRLGGTGTLLAVDQVHGARVVGADEVKAGAPEARNKAGAPEARNKAGAPEARKNAVRLEADAIVSTLPGAVISIRVADCVPILMAAPRGVAAVHAGWRGTAADIARIALRALCERAECSPSEVRAAIGPCISGAVYEVGPEVHDAVGAVTPAGDWAHASNGRWRVDLAAANAAILRNLGVNVEVLGWCTVGDPAFWSHRRDGATGGRQAAVIRWPG